MKAIKAAAVQAAPVFSYPAIFRGGDQPIFAVDKPLQPAISADRNDNRAAVSAR